MPLFLRLAIFTTLFPGTICVLGPWLLYRHMKVETVNPALAALAAGMIATGVATYVTCALDFAGQGRGTPAPYDPPSALVVMGLYRFSRNPMYVGVLCVLFGEALLIFALRLFVYAGLIALAFQLRVVLYEEPALRRKFGAKYLEYCERAPRWLGWSKKDA